MSILFILLVGGLVVAGLVAGVIVVLVRLTDSPKSEPYVPHAWPVSPITAPGWYPDGSNPNLLRYYDGQQWTSATRGLS
ncbi:MAG: hypothetical protein QOF15_331 [Mycobacterium sp.]|nr:hypothetical protein [Mycobacterium sp.]